MEFLTLNFWIGTIIGAVVGAVFEGIVGYYISNIMKSRRDNNLKKKRAENNTKLLDLFSKQDYSLNSNGIIMLAHGVPTYSPESLNEGKVDKCFYYPIPEKYRDILNTFGFSQKKTDDIQYSDEDNCLFENFWGKDNFARGLSTIGINWDDTIKKDLDIIANNVAKSFHEDLKNGKVRFNGAMYGVDYFDPGRSSGEELPTVTINFYKTDYFTYRVFSCLYQNHRIGNNAFKKDFINSLSYPFLASFGIAFIAIISTNKCNAAIEGSDVIVIGRRSNDVIVDKGRLHFTMNEAFSIRDMNVNNPSFELCAIRGFVEELKWSKHIHGLKFGDLKFTDFFFNNNACEMGVVGYVKIETSEELPLEEAVDKLTKLYKESQDGILETNGLVFVAMKDARTYLQKQKEFMSIGFATALDCLLRRYELNLI